MKALRDTGLCLFSAILLILAFPVWDAGCLAWAALVPLLWVLSGRGPKSGFLLAFLWGNCFFLGIFSWILEIPQYRWYHHGLLSIYLGSYIGLFGLGFVYLKDRLGRSAALWAVPLLWVALEYLRGNFSFLSLPWGFIAHSQYRYPAVTRCVSVVGTYGLSGLLVLVNAAIAAMIFNVTAYREQGSKRGQNRSEWALGVLAALCLLSVFAYGQGIVTQPLTGRSLSVSLVQGNISQAKKWDLRYADEILQKYSSLTLKASNKPTDLIVWPETAVPGSIIEDESLLNQIKSLARKSKTPMVIGSARFLKFQETQKAQAGRVNSAFLVLPEEQEADLQRYDKTRLFPFGEYLPYQEVLPWKWIHVSSLGHYVPGTTFTVFDLLPHRFAVTICWENIFPDLVRRFVRKGAQFIVNITNEARFGKTAAPFQLVAISVFRAVENGIFVIRCANTGISCIIDPYGRIVRLLQDEQGEILFIEGVIQDTIAALESNTLYTRYGDVAPVSALAGCAAFFLFALRGRASSREKRKNP